MNFNGHSHASTRSPNTRFKICSTGIGLTATSRLVVIKSQKTLGQKKPSIAAPTCPIYFACQWIGSSYGGDGGGRGIRTSRGREHEEACPVVFDQPTHVGDQLSRTK